MTKSHAGNACLPLPKLMNGLPQNPEVSSGAGTVEPTELALRVPSGKAFCARGGMRDQQH
jgi:hypothetical protein